MVYAGLFVCASGLYNIFERQILQGATDIDDRGQRLARFRALLALVLFGSAVLGAAHPAVDRFQSGMCGPRSTPPTRRAIHTVFSTSLTSH